MVEIHGAHGYLVSSFISPYMNKRTDEFGGSLENRMRFPLEIVKTIREAVGADYPVSFRFSADEFLEGGITLQESPLIAKMLEVGGVSVINVSTGTYETHNKLEDIMCQPEGWKLPIWQAIKQAVKVSVIAGGGIKTPEFADRVLADGKADFIGLARPLLADPDWPKKAAEGKAEEIRRCISCQCCVGGRAPTPRRGMAHCSVNAEWGREREFAELKPAEARKRVIVVGAGPGGMEAARIASARGHQVTLYDKGKELGGQLLLAGRPPGKEKILWLRDYLATQIEKLGVEVRLGTEMTVSMIERERPDAVVIATGSEPLIPDTPGIGDKKVVTAWDVLADKVKIENSRVAVVGGGNVGCETAELLSEAGNTVTILEMLPAMASNMDPDNGTALLERLQEKGVVLLTEREVSEIVPRGLLCTQKGSQNPELIDADWIVLALGTKPSRSLADALEGRVPELHAIGDCNEPRIIMEAIYEGSLAGRMI